MKNHITFIPSGGLGNRMRAVVSAYHLAEECADSRLRVEVIWFRDWAVNAPFHSIFKPVELPALHVREGRGSDMILYDRPRKRNLYVPRLFQNFLFDQRIDEYEVTPLKDKQFDFVAWARGHGSYMSCYQDFGAYDDRLFGMLFKPVDEVEQRISAMWEEIRAHAQTASPRVIGLHIRRTDNAASITGSPLELFEEAVRHETEAHADVMVYLATDDEDVKASLRRVFGQCIVTSNAAAERNSVEGIRGGLADMYMLSRTQKIYGSVGSSFSVISSKIGGVPLEIVRVK